MQQSKELQVVRHAVGFMREPVGQNIDWSGDMGSPNQPPSRSSQRYNAAIQILDFLLDILPLHSLRPIAIYPLIFSRGGEKKAVECN